MKSFSTILQGEEATEEYAIEFARCFDFSESETEEVTTRHKYYFIFIDTVNGIKIYYQWRADYYFFVPELED